MLSEVVRTKCISTSEHACMHGFKVQCMHEVCMQSCVSCTCMLYEFMKRTKEKLTRE
jgi:hypothetical protein